jgi:hypothetical protein
MAEQINTEDKPNFPKFLFWDFRFDEIDWRKGYKTVIARIIERGNEEEWLEMIRFYTRDKIIHALQKEIVFLPEYIIEKVCTYFSLRKEDLLCYTRNRWKPKLWI